MSEPNLEALKRPLSAEEIEWKIQTVNKEGTSALVVPYPTARTVMERLDEAFGTTWSVDYEHHDKGVMCTISIRGKEAGYTSREDGAEYTDIEPFKGGISSALKRAGVAWGIGRELYKMDQVWVNLGNTGSKRVKLKDGSFRKWDPPIGTAPARSVQPVEPRRETSADSTGAVPQFDDGEIPFPDSVPFSDTGKAVSPEAPAPTSYTVPFGKFRGKALADCDQEQLEGYIDWLEGQGNLKPMQQEFVNHAKAHFAGQIMDADVPL